MHHDVQRSPQAELWRSQQAQRVFVREHDIFNCLFDNVYSDDPNKHNIFNCHFDNVYSETDDPNEHDRLCSILQHCSGSH